MCPAGSRSGVRCATARSASYKTHPEACMVPWIVQDVVWTASEAVHGVARAAVRTAPGAAVAAGQASLAS
eukprot:360935-Chlamydomonas_euryale.AAC.1